MDDQNNQNPPAADQAEGMVDTVPAAQPGEEMMQSGAVEGAEPSEDSAATEGTEGTPAPASNDAAAEEAAPAAPAEGEENNA